MTFIWHSEINKRTEPTDDKPWFLSKQQLYIHLHRSDFRNYTSNRFYNEGYCAKPLFRFFMCFYFIEYSSSIYTIDNIHETLELCSGSYTPEFYVFK